MSEWTKYEEDFVKENYNKYTKQQLSEMLGKSKGAIQQKANRMGIKKKSAYHYNKDFFKNICTDQQAYWLGFIFADGWITDYELGIELNESDDSHLRKFNKDISGNLQVKYRERRPTIIDGRQVGVRHTCRLNIFSKDIVDDLISHGCIKNKSLFINQPKNIQDKYMRHFIRGYFDGNGCIRFDKRKLINGEKEYLRVCICSGSIDFVEWLSSFLSTKKYDNYISKDEEHNSYNIWICSGSLIKFLDYMYKNTTVYLDRKYNVYKNLINANKVVV